MRSRIRVAALATLAGVVALGCQPPRSAQEESDSSEVAARVMGEPILVSALDERVKEALFRKETRNRNAALLYDLRRNTLNELLREVVLEKESARQGVSIEDLVRSEVEQIGPVSEEEIAAFYEKNKDRLRGQPLEEVDLVIRDYLMATRDQLAAERLVERADVEVVLAPPRFQVAGDGPSLGPENAPVTIVEFSDFQCPFCRRASEVVKELRELYPEKVRLVYRQFPLENIHPRARAAAEASLCAADQERFWEYHDVLFENARKLADEDLVGYAKGLELDVESFEKCLTERTHRAAVDQDLAAGSAAGVEATPAFFVNGVLLTGALPVDRFTELIDAELGTGGGERS